MKALQVLAEWVLWFAVISLAVYLRDGGEGPLLAAAILGVGGILTRKIAGDG